MKAIILAAGQGTRLRPLTDDKPKCMVEFQGKPIIDHIIDNFILCGIDDIVVVNGYKGNILEQHLENQNIKFIQNEKYDSTNMVHSLFCASSEFNDDLIISYSDIIYSPKILKKLIDSHHPISLAIDLKWKELWEIRMENIISDVETLKMTSKGTVSEIGQKPEVLSEIEGQYIGLISVRKNSVKVFENLYSHMENKKINGRNRSNIFMTDFLQEIINSGIDIFAEKFYGGWVEIDSISDISLYNENLHKVPSLKWSSFHDPVVQIAVDAGKAIMKYFGHIEVESVKVDDSPLTKADLKANELIIQGLRKLDYKYPVISEENVKTTDWIQRSNWETYWIVDPLDGTKEFLKNSNDFTVNIALIHKTNPVLGVVYAPAYNVLYLASKNWGSIKFNFSKNNKTILQISGPSSPLNIIVSESHKEPDLEKYLTYLPEYKCVSMGSSLKICKIADGTCDIYPRLGPLSEWDIAASDVILSEAGGFLFDYMGNKISYESFDGRIDSFIAAGIESNALFPEVIKNIIKNREK